LRETQDRQTELKKLVYIQLRADMDFGPAVKLFYITVKKASKKRVETNFGNVCFRSAGLEMRCDTV
jgi:hypothetical protein